MNFSKKSRFILSKNKLLEQYRKLEKCSDEIVYSYKTNPIVGKVLEKLTNCKFAICSFHSINDIKNKLRIVYFIQGDGKKELVEVLESGVRSFVADNENDLAKLISVLNKEKVKVELFLRTKVREHTIYTGKYFVYGISWSRANELIPKLTKNKLIERIGIHFHRKTQNVGEWFLTEDFKEVMPPEVRKFIHAVNIGGGIPLSLIHI